MSADKRPAEKRLREENQEYEQINGRLHMLLVATANALKGEPPKNMLHDLSDVPYVARVLVKRMRNCTCGAAETPFNQRQR